MDKIYAEEWWNDKLRNGYGVQQKHLAVAELVDGRHFPLVDLGAGNGRLLQLLETAFSSADLSGVELSASAIESKECRAPITNESIMEWIPNKKPSTLTLVDVLEHLPDPLPLLKRLSEISPRLIVACPNFNFLTARLTMLSGKIPFQNKQARGGHIFWCQYNALKELYYKAGYTIVRENHLYPRHTRLRKILSIRPSLFAHEFVFMLERSNAI